MDWKKEYSEKLCSPEKAVKLVKNGDRVFFGTASSQPYVLAEALYKRKDELSDVTVCSGLTVRPLKFFTGEARGHFKTLTYFAGPAERMGIKYGQTEYTSFSLSQIDAWCNNTAKANVAFLEVSPPDENGYMCYGAYGISMHDFVRENAETVILQVNKKAPYVYGQRNLIHISQAAAVVETDEKLDEFVSADFDDDLKKISAYIVDEIPDGATVQLGIGGLSAAVGIGLKNKRDLGVHSEMMTDSMMELMEQGVITNERKTFMPGKTVAAFAFGSRKLYDFIDHNDNVYFGPYTFVNDVREIAKNDNMISVNTAMAVDLYGQVYADSLGGKQQSAVGGQLDYVRGAQMSKGGKSFIAITSTLAKKDGSLESRIMLSAPPCSAVTTPRADVQYVVTEYGCVNLKSLTMGDRARAMISLAHPMFREKLTYEAKKMGLI